MTTLLAGADYISDPVPIEVSDRFFVSVRYGDARFGQNRTCAGMLSFTPLTNHQYMAELTVHNNVQGCRIGIYDTTSGTKTKVPFELPAHACNDTKLLGNGRPLWRNHHYTVNVVPSR